MKSKSYAIAVNYKNGKSGTETVSGTSKSDAEKSFAEQVSQRSDVKNWTVIGDKDSLS